MVGLQVNNSPQSRKERKEKIEISHRHTQTTSGLFTFSIRKSEIESFKTAFILLNHM